MELAAAIPNRFEINSASWEELEPYYDALVIGRMDPAYMDAGHQKRMSARQRYLHYFRLTHSANRPLSFNWCGFLFSYLWLAYRKMPGLACLFLLFWYISEAFVLAVTKGTGISQYCYWLVLLAYCCLAGVLADPLYFRACRSRMENALTLPHDQAISALKNRGGTSKGSMWILLIATILFKPVVDTLIHSAVKILF